MIQLFTYCQYCYHSSPLDNVVNVTVGQICALTGCGIEKNALTDEAIYDAKRKKHACPFFNPRDNIYRLDTKYSNEPNYKCCNSPRCAALIFKSIKNNIVDKSWFECKVKDKKIGEANGKFVKTPIWCPREDWSD